jgi:hypothetical protein
MSAKRTSYQRSVHGKRAKVGPCTLAQRDFQALIDAISAKNILYALAEFLGRSDYDPLDDLVQDPKKRASRHRSKAVGLHFTGAHWTGHDIDTNGDDVVYDSYEVGLQLPGTNNYCQSYACYLWANGGRLHNDVIGVTLCPRKYMYNIM